MSPRSHGPFEQRKLGYRERKAADRRAAARAAARAEAMPPPAPESRVDLTGRQPATPVAATSSHQATPPAPTVPAPAPSALPHPAGWPQASHAASPAPATSPAPHPSGGPAPVSPWGSPAAPHPGVPTLPTPQPADAAASGSATAPNLLTSAARPWTGRWAQLGLYGGSLTAVVGFAAALGWGAPVLDHPADAPALLAGLAGLAAGVFMMTRGWQAIPRRPRRAAVAVAGLLVAAFALGVATNPMVVDGQVFLATSKEAREYKMMRQIHTDLLRLRQLDVYLTYSPADAGAHYNEYEPALAELTSMSTTYAGLTADDLPDPRFAETVSAVKSAAYWAAKAMESKIALLEQEDARFADNVATFRTNFAQQYVAAGRALNFLSADLNIPVDTREHE